VRGLVVIILDWVTSDKGGDRAIAIDLAKDAIDEVKAGIEAAG